MTDTTATQTPAATTQTTPGATPDAAAQAAVTAAAPAKTDAPNETIAAITRAKKRELQLKRELDSERAKVREYEGKVKEYEPEVNKFRGGKKDPIQALMAAGYTYQDATNFILNAEKPTADMIAKELRDELGQVKNQLAETEKQRLEREASDANSHHERQVQQFKGSIGDFLTKNAETFELTNLYADADFVFDTISQHWDKQEKAKQADEDAPDPKVLSVKEACELIERDLEERFEKGMQSKKMKAKWTAAGAKEQPQPKGFSSDQPKTLSNYMGSAASPGQLSPRIQDDRIKRAMARLG